MITLSTIKRRHVLSMNTTDLGHLAELVWVLYHTPPPVGYNRKPLTAAQRKVVEDLYELIPYPDGYGASLNGKTGQ